MHDFWRQIASGAEPEARVEPERPTDGELLKWHSDGFEEAAELLGALDPAKPAWTWSSQRNVGFIQRRIAQETAVQAWDARQRSARRNRSSGNWPSTGSTST